METHHITSVKSVCDNMLQLSDGAAFLTRLAGQLRDSNDKQQDAIAQLDS